MDDEGEEEEIEEDDTPEEPLNNSVSVKLKVTEEDY